MKIFFLLSLLLTFLTSCGKNIESQAKEQVEKTLTELAKNPESVQISNVETIFHTDSTCVLHLVFRGQNGFGGYSRENLEYIYALQKSGDIYEGIVNLDDTESRVETAKEFYNDNIKKSKSPEELEKWIEGSVGIYVCLHGRKIETAE